MHGNFDPGGKIKAITEKVEHVISAKVNIVTNFASEHWTLLKYVDRDVRFTRHTLKIEIIDVISIKVL